jgi:multicopper oxidase
VLDPTTKAVISYSGHDTMIPSNFSSDWADAHPDECTDLDERDLVPIMQIRPPPATVLHRIDFSFGIGANQMDYAKVNGTTWARLSNATTLSQAVSGLHSGGADSWAAQSTAETFAANQFVVGVSNNETVDVVDVLLYSLDEGSHPFHLHGHEFVSTPSKLYLCRGETNAVSGFFKPGPAPSTGRTTTPRSCLRVIRRPARCEGTR